MMMLVVIALGLACVLGERHARRREERGEHPGLFFGFWKHAAGNFGTGPLLLLALAAALTWGMVVSGWDVSVQKFLQARNPLGEAIPWIFLLGGNFWHMILAAAVFYRGKWLGNLDRMGAGLAGIQALLVNALFNTSQKFLTGRRGPDNLLDLSAPSHAPFPKTRNPADFQFDFWNRGHSDGRFFWPSGHTSAIFAFVAALRTYYPEKRWIPWVGYPFALLTALAMVDGDFHWASDVLAGGILGEVVGRFVGRGFRRRYRAPE